MQAEDWANNKEYKGERVGENGVGRKRLLVRKNRITLDNAPCSGGGGMIYVSERDGISLANAPCFTGLIIYTFEKEWD